MKRWVFFLDNLGNAVAFGGSQNETVGGLLRNFESFDVHWSWDGPQQPRVQQKLDNFNRLWDNVTERLEVVDFPTAVTEELLIHQTVYDTTPDVPPDLPEIVEPAVPYLPKGIVLRAYQSKAIDAWFENGCRGLWEMATGTGKTITALSALARLREEKGHLFVLIACPYQHLVDQWAEVVGQFGFEPILAYKSSGTWVNKVNDAVALHNWRIDKVACINYNPHHLYWWHYANVAF